MRSTGTVLALLLLAAAPAAAQPQGPTRPPPTTQPTDDATDSVDTVMPPVDTQPVEPEPEPEPAPPPAPPPEPPPPAPVPEVEAEPVATRPEGFSVGIGIGYDIPADLQAPNRASVRFRLPSGMILEPIAGIVRSGDSTDTGDVEIESSQFAFVAATMIRFPWQLGPKIDLSLIGGAGLSYSNTNPDGDNNETTQMSLALQWGLGLDYWISKHWTLSATATNPLFAYTTRTEEFGPDMDTTTSGTDIALIFAPDVLVMVHLWF